MMKAMPTATRPPAATGPSRAASTPKPLADAEELTRLGTAIARIGRGFRTASAGHRLSPSQLAVLAAVVRSGPVGIAALAEGEAINPTLLSRIVGRLESDGLIERRAGESDRRCVVVVPTAAGRRLQARVRTERGAWLATRLAELDARDARAIVNALPALERLARAGVSPGPA